MKKFLIVLFLVLTCVCLTLSACKKKAEEASPLPTEEVAPAPEEAEPAEQKGIITKLKREANLTSLFLNE